MYCVLNARQTMKAKLSLILLVVGLAGCQSKSEVDKCVQAYAVQTCNQLVGKKLEPFYILLNQSESSCIQEFEKLEGGKWRLECLKAQSGK